ncbi:MAG: hypothetical protein ACJ8C4_05160 [Gemmataceae bacterium]
MFNLLRRSRRARRTNRPLRLEMLERRDTPAWIGNVGLPSLNDLAPSRDFTGLTPAIVRSVYGFDSISADGTGQTIAIITAYNNATLNHDYSVFNHTFGLPDSSLTQVSLGRTTSNSAWSMETSLDVQWAHVAAPGANLLVVQANSSRLGDMLDAVNFARNQPNVSVVSMSWGTPEFEGQTAFDSYFTTPDGHQGITFVAASGDSGSSRVMWPASSPNVVAVGGTSLSIDSSGNVDEAAWRSGTGGVSRMESDPLSNAFSSSSSNSRFVPDVSYAADPRFGFMVYNSSAKGWAEVGGTSAGAPQWAGLFAVSNQLRADAGMPTMTNARAAVATVSADSFNDVVDGSNGFSANVGFDMASGRGSPVAGKLAQNLAETKTSDSFVGPLPAPAKPVRANASRSVNILAISSAQVAPLITQLIPPPQFTQPQDRSRDFSEQVVPQASPPILAPTLKPIGDADLSARGGGGGETDMSGDQANPPAPGVPGHPSENAPASGPTGGTFSIYVPMSNVGSAANFDRVADGFASTTPEMPPTDEDSSTRPALAIAAFALLGGVFAPAPEEKRTAVRKRRRMF